MLPFTRCGPERRSSSLSRRQRNPKLRQRKGLPFSLIPPLLCYPALPSRALRGADNPLRSSHPRGRPGKARQSDKTCLGYAPGSKMVIADTLKNCPTAVPMSVLLPLYGTTMTFASMQ